LDNILAIRHEPCTVKLCRVLSVPVDKEAWEAACRDEEAHTFRMKAIQRKEGFELRDNIIYFKGKLYVPVSNRRDLVEGSHYSPVARHDGMEATAARLASFWWPKMKQLIHEVVASCEACQRRKERRAPAGRMEEHEAFEPMAVVAFDVLGPLPGALARRKFVLVGVDHFSRFMVAKPMRDQTAAKFVKFSWNSAPTLGSHRGS